LRIYRKPMASSFARAPVRIDDGVREGDTITPFYDPMIAKLIVHGATREEALGRLDEALSQLHIVGVANNVQFLRQVVRSRSFALGDLDTALITREQDHLFGQEPIGLPLAGAAAIAQALADERAMQGADPFSRRDGWNSHGVRVRPFEFEFHGERAKAELTYLHDGALALAIGNVAGALSFSQTGEGLVVDHAGQRLAARVYADGETDHVFAAAGATQIVNIDLLAHAGETHDEGGRLTAPMPGKVLHFNVKPGDSVHAGQVLAVMEAMKMEHAIAAPADGVVAELLYAPGDQVPEGAELLTIAASGE
jgi:3-methylcrotonyl-CoA carboxylase alpha subunit